MKYLQFFIFIFLLSGQVKAQLEHYTLVYFLSESCPICQNQTQSINQLQTAYQNMGLKTIAYFPNESISDENSIMHFKSKYNLNFPLLVDTNQHFTKKYQAKVTPQVFLINSQSGEIIYSGKIDNSFERVGKRRQKITEFYLNDAIKSIIFNENIKLKRTEPVGCIISLLK